MQLSYAAPRPDRKTVLAMTTLTAARPAQPRGRAERPALWDPGSGRFDPARLRRAILIRGLTADDFALSADCSRTSVYKALSGAGVRDRTALAIVAALERVPPRFHLD